MPPLRGRDAPACQCSSRDGILLMLTCGVDDDVIRSLSWSDGTCCHGLLAHLSRGCGPHLRTPNLSYLKEIRCVVRTKLGKDINQSAAHATPAYPCVCVRVLRVYVCAGACRCVRVLRACRWVADMLRVIVGGTMRSPPQKGTIRNGKIIMDSSYVVLARRCTGIERCDAGWIWW